MSGKADPLRVTLNRLIQESKVTFSAEDVMREFRCTKDKGKISDRKLLKVLDLISRNQPNCKEYLAEAAQIISQDPMYALLVFLERYTSKEENKPQSLQKVQSDTMLRKKDISTSTPFVARQQPKQHYEVAEPTTPENNGAKSHSVYQPPAAPKAVRPKAPVNELVTPEEVSDIKERVLNAATTGGSALCTSRLPRSNSAVTIPSAASSSSKTSKSSRLSNTDLVYVNTMPEGHRTDSLWDFYNIENNYSGIQKPQVAAIPLQSQENILLWELLHVLSGVRGTYIKPSERNESITRANFEYYCTSFEISPQIHTSLSDIAQEVLPLASHHNCVEKFIHQTQDKDAGQVLEALGAGMRDISHDYYLLLAQLETELLNGSLTLNKLLFYVRPTLNIQEILASTVAELDIKNLRGAAALTLLYNRINTLTGDEDARTFIVDLMELAVVPYMNILQLWIQKGVIVDPGQEFMVIDNEVIRSEQLPEHYSADYWEKRYNIRRECVPCFLERVSDIILRTGKYLNVIRQCGKKVIPSQNMRLVYSATQQQHIKVIEDAYHFASKTLLDVLLNENDLMGHLMSVKRYLLLHQGDFIMQFMDACEEELSKNVDHVLPITLENLLGLTLRLSSARNDPYKDDLHCELLTYDLVTQMSKIMNNEEGYWQTHDRLDLNGLECFAFTYEVQWPISLVLNHIAISKYQMLFRQLFFCKHVERQLCKIWKENAIAKKFSPHAAELYRSAFTLRQRMMNAIQNLEYYMMIEIIEPNWHRFLLKMQKVENVDEVFVLHQDFLDSCLKNCMLTDTTLLNRSIFKMCNICLKFCDFIQRSQRVFLDAELKSMVCDSNDENTDTSDSEYDLSAHKQCETSLDPTDTFSERVKRFDLEFTGVLIGFLNQINDIAAENTSDCFMNLVHRINFNYFYTEQMDVLCTKDGKSRRTNVSEAN